MKQSQVYSEAAKKVANEQNLFTCDAIKSISVDFLDLLQFEIYFNDYFYTDKFFLGPATSENQLVRSLALLLMAEITKENE